MPPSVHTSNTKDKALLGDLGMVISEAITFLAQSLLSSYSDLSITRFLGLTSFSGLAPQG